LKFIHCSFTSWLPDQLSISSREGMGDESVLRDILSLPADASDVEIFSNAAQQIQHLQKAAAVVQAIATTEAEGSGDTALANRVLAVYGAPKGAPMAGGSKTPRGDMDGRAVLDSVQGLCGAVAQRFSAVSSLHTSEVHSTRCRNRRSAAFRNCSAPYFAVLLRYSAWSSACSSSLLRMGN